MTLSLGDLHRQYTVGETSDDVLSYCRDLNAQSLRAVISGLGEKSNSPEQAVGKMRSYCNLLRNVERMDATVSVKPSDVGLGLSPAFAEENMTAILTIARESGKTVEIDMEFRTLLEPILALCRRLVSQGHSLRIAVQSALVDAAGPMKELQALSRVGGGDLSFRIVTGSCYHKSTLGYVTTLETAFGETHRQFLEMVDISALWAEGGNPRSSVGTGDVERIEYAAGQGLELQFLKGEERKAGYLAGAKLHASGAAMTVYATFGPLSDPGVQAYLMRRI